MKYVGLMLLFFVEGVCMTGTYNFNCARKCKRYCSYGTSFTILNNVILQVVEETG